MGVDLQHYGSSQTCGALMHILDGMYGLAAACQAAGLCSALDTGSLIAAILDRLSGCL